MKQDHYFQFPLCALSFGPTLDERLNAIITYSVAEAGSRLFRKLTAAEQQDFLAQRRQAGPMPSGFNKHSWVHQATLFGAQALNVTLGHFVGLVDEYHRLREYIAAFEARHGRDAKVRIKTAWLFAARDHRGISYREFSVLCGIFSVIGDKKLAIITRNRIRRCALGYRTQAIMDSELPRRTDKAHPLTERQLRDTIEQLHRNRFFARCTVARRITYYSIRLDNEAMRKKVLERRTHAGFFRASQAAQNQALTAAIEQQRREVAGTAPRSSPLHRDFPSNCPAGLAESAVASSVTPPYLPNVHRASNEGPVKVHLNRNPLTESLEKEFLNSPPQQKNGARSADLKSSFAATKALLAEEERVLDYERTQEDHERIQKLRARLHEIQVEQSELA